MKPNVSAVKEKDVQIFTSDLMTQPTPTVAPKRNGQKYVCVSVAVVILVAMVIGGFFGAMHMFHSNKLTTFEMSLKNAAGIYGKEKIEVDEDQETATYEGNNNKSEFKLIMDYKRGLSIGRVWINQKEPLCFVTHLNKEGLPTIEKLARFLETQKESQLEPDINAEPVQESFTVDLDPISDISFLGEEVEVMCEGLTTYWAFPRNPSKGRSTTMRQKRDDNEDYVCPPATFCPNITIHCPLPQYEFLGCKQDAQESNCTYKCCEEYFCIVILMLTEEFELEAHEYCLAFDCTKTVHEDKCCCVYNYQYVFNGELYFSPLQACDDRK